MKLVTVLFVLLVFSVLDYSSSQSASASSPKGGASASGSASAPKSSPKGGASASGSASAPKSSPKAGASASASAPKSSPKAGASASGSAPKPSPKGGASAPGSASGPGASSPKADAGASAKLPDGYVMSGKSKGFIMAVKLNKKNKETWNGARKACYHEGNGAFLAYAETKEEENMYLKMMKDNKVNDLWVGIHDLFESNGQYSTVRGEVAKEAAHFTWFPGEPNSNRGPEPCGEYRIAHGKKGLNDRKCNFKFPYMCKIKIPQPKTQ